MTFSALQTRRFARQYTKLHDNVAADVDAAVVSVCHASRAGERRKIDLSVLWVHKSKSQHQVYLLG